MCSLPKGWEVKKLIDIAEVSTGKWNANHANKTGKYRFYTCAYNHGMCNTKRFSGKTLILPGNGVNVGEVFYYEGEFDAYQRTYVIFNINISPKYLHYHMRLFWKELGTKLQYGSATNFIKIGNFENYSVEHPPLPEQKRIVAILEKAFTAIDQAKANTEKNLKNARELFQSKLQETFANGKLKIDTGEWEEKKLEDSCNLITCGVAAKPKYVDQGIGVPFLSAQNVKNGNVILNNYKYISKDFHKTLTKKNKPCKGDILYSRVGAKFGEAGVVEHNFEFSVYVSLTLIKPKIELLDSYYLKFYLNSPDVKKIAKQSISSSGVPNLNVKSVRQFTIQIPSMKEQKQIVKKLDAVSTETKKLEAIYQRKITCLDELKKSILQKAFNGELLNNEV